MKKIFDSILRIVIGAAIFIFLGYYAPLFYYQYVDRTVYYSIKLPIKVEHSKDHYPCSFVDVYLERNALVDIHGDITLDLVLVRIDKNKEIVSKLERSLDAQKGELIVITHWQIPCEVKPGIYYWTGFANYQINNITKKTPLVTEEFEVKTKPSGVE